jgi:hypothetical protein
MSSGTTNRRSRTPEKNSAPRMMRKRIIEVPRSLPPSTAAIARKPTGIRG